MRVAHCASFVCLLVVLSACYTAAKYHPLPAPFTEKCLVDVENRYPPPKGSAPEVPWFTIDLDLPPEQRWTEVATAYKDRIESLITVVKNLSFPFVQNRLIDWVDKHIGSWDEKIVQPYADELRGISNVTGIPLGEIVLFNAFYEIFTVCTSIVAEDPNGKIFHARNLDFGIFMGWDPIKHDWILTDALRPTVINLEWKKGGKTVFKSVNFAGFIGIYNGVKQGAFTVTANERFSLNGGYIGIIEWLLGTNNATWMTFLTRDTLIQAETYADAVSQLSNTPLMSPVYFIVGGKDPGEGTVISRSRTAVLNTTQLDTTLVNGWYLLQTNYDPWKAPLFIDDRRTPGNICMQRLGRERAGFEGIFNVLSSTTNLNKLTVYTVLMQVDEGKLETYIQYCPQPCWFS